MVFPQARVTQERSVDYGNNQYGADSDHRKNDG